MIFSKHISDASGICLNLGGLHGALPDLDHGDLRVLDLEDGGGQLLERVVTVASPLLSDRRPDAGRLCRKFLKGQDKIYVQNFFFKDQLDIFTQHREDSCFKTTG